MKILDTIKESWIVTMFTSNRFKSFYWRAGGQVASMFLIEIQSYVTDLRPHWIGTVILGLIISEITKELNKAR